MNRKKGKIVNVSSISGIRGVPETAAYCAAKAAIINLTRVMAWELAPYKINVNGIAPGAVDTPMFEGVNHEKALRNIPWGRIGVPQDIAKTALFLASDDSDFVTGHTIVVDGGQTAGQILPFSSPRKRLRREALRQTR